MRILHGLLLSAVTLMGLAFPLEARDEAKPKAEAAEPLTVRIRAAYATAPAPLRMVVRAEPHVDNRRLRVAIDSGVFYRSSEMPLDGLAAPRTHLLEWKALPAGNYCIQVMLIRAGDSPISLRRQFLVVGGGVDPVEARAASPACAAADTPAFTDAHEDSFPGGGKRE